MWANLGRGIPPRKVVSSRVPCLCDGLVVFFVRRWKGIPLQLGMGRVERVLITWGGVQEGISCLRLLGSFWESTRFLLRLFGSAQVL